jgi:DUF4097 and DUF4098 domain-containing protein YvlB
MSPRHLLALATLAITPFALAADKDFDRTLSTSATPSVHVNTGSGYIHLKPGNDNQVHIHGRVHANNGFFGDAESRVQQIANNPPIEQNGNEVTIGRTHDNDLFHNISIDYDVTLPRASAIAANTGSGDMTIDNVGATLSARTGSGNVHATGIQGASNVGTGSGDVDVQITGPGEVKASTGSGNVHLRGVNGGLQATTGSGDIEVQGSPVTDWRLRTGSGSVRMDLGTSAKFNLVADTGSGSVNIAQPITMQGSMNRHHINGSVNGGGPEIHASTGSGDISIR